MKPNLAFIFFIPFLLALTPGSNAARPPVPQQPGRRTDERHTSEFRYIITSNYVAEYRHPERYVHVLLDESAFSEGTLIRLFSLISKRFPEPERLWVDVATSLWQMSTPEEDDLGVMSERGLDPHDDKHPKAILIRRGGNELIRYTPHPATKYINLKTVILKGRDPQARSGGRGHRRVLTRRRA